MALRTFVKISQVNNLSDARYCAGMGVAMLGFNLEPGTVHYIDPDKFRELSEWIAGVSFAAEFTNATPETIVRLLGEYPVDYVQIDNPDYLQELQQLDLPLILRVHITATTTSEELEKLFTAFQPLVSFFLLETTSAGLTPKAQLDSLLGLGSRYPLVAGYGFNENTVSQLIKEQPLKGIALKGGQEIRAGFKNFDELADILEALEVDEAY